MAGSHDKVWWWRNQTLEISVIRRPLATMLAIGDQSEVFVRPFHVRTFFAAPTESRASAAEGMFIKANEAASVCSPEPMLKGAELFISSLRGLWSGLESRTLLEAQAWPRRWHSNGILLTTNWVHFQHQKALLRNWSFRIGCWVCLFDSSKSFMAFNNSWTGRESSNTSSRYLELFGYQLYLTLGQGKSKTTHGMWKVLTWVVNVAQPHDQSFLYFHLSRVCL